MGAPTNPEQWAAMERLRFIERSAWWRGIVRRQDVCGVFGVGAAQVSADFQKYLEMNPGALVYSLNRKRYEGSQGMVRLLDTSTLEQAITQFIDRAGRLPVAGRVEAPESPQVDWLVMPERRVAPDVERRVFHAVLHGMRLEVMYASLNSRGWRSIMPHALAWSGHRWHARAWCFEKGEYRDFVLGRMEEARWPQAPAEPLPIRDEAWETKVTVELRPHPDLSPEKRAMVAGEFHMEKGTLKITARKAMVQYLETFLGLTPTDGKPQPPKLERVMIHGGGRTMGLIEVMPRPFSRPAEAEASGGILSLEQ
ncbi:MAG: WYL domain-containing protein [Verrucomicrobiota bacterium]